MRNLVVLTVTLAFCLPVNAELLVFKTITTGQQLNTQTQVVEKKNEQGFLVLNVDMANPAGIIVNEAYHLTYATKSKVKIQATTILNPQNVELILAPNNGKNAKMILRWFDDPTGTYAVVSGTVKKTDIGGLYRSIALSASGNIVWRLQDYMTGYGSISLKLDTADTKASNTKGMTAIDTVETLSQYLVSKGYRSDL